MLVGEVVVEVVELVEGGVGVVHDGDVFLSQQLRVHILAQDGYEHFDDGV